MEMEVAQTVKNLPIMQKTQVQSLGWEDPLEKETTTRSSIFAWEIPRTEEPQWAIGHEVAKELDVTQKPDNSNKNLSIYLPM